MNKACSVPGLLHHAGLFLDPKNLEKNGKARREKYQTGELKEKSPLLSVRQIEADGLKEGTRLGNVSKEPRFQAIEPQIFAPSSVSSSFSSSFHHFNSHSLSSTGGMLRAPSFSLIGALPTLESSVGTV